MSTSSSTSDFRHSKTSSSREDTVVFVLNGLGIGGSERKMVAVANELASRGRAVILAYLDNRETLLEQIRDSVEVIWLRRRGKLSLRALFGLVRIADREHVGSLCAVGLYPMLYGYLARALSRRSSPLKLLLFINATELVGVKARFLMHVYKHVLQHVDKIIFGSVDQRQRWELQYGIKRSKGHVIYNGVDLRRFKPSFGAKRSLSGDILRIGSVGRLSVEKNQMVLLDVSAELIQRGIPHSVVLAGDGPMYPALQERSRLLGVTESVHFVGAIEDVRVVLDKLDVFVLPSRTETFSNAALEAMAMGCVVVLARVGGLPEMIEHGQSGLLYDLNRTSDLCDLLTALAADVKLRSDLSKAARDRAASRFSFEGMVNNYEVLLYRDRDHRQCGNGPGMSM